MLKIPLFFLLLLVLSMNANFSFAVAKYQTTKLPVSDEFLSSDPEAAVQVLALEVHQDSSNPDHYYYIPPFHIRQYREGAAGPFLHAPQIERYAEAKAAMKEKDEFMAEEAAKINEYDK